MLVSEGSCSSHVTVMVRPAQQAGARLMGSSRDSCLLWTGKQVPASLCWLHAAAGCGTHPRLQMSYALCDFDVSSRATC